LTLRAPRGGPPLQRVSILHPSYLPLHYVLLFPHGDPGWHPGLCLLETHGPRKRTQLTLNHYHAYRLFTRRDEFNTLFRAQRLFQQYLVDAAVHDATNHFYLQGAGGTGKTFLYRAIYGHLKADGKSILCVASSGIAATLLPRGRTAHSQFKIPLMLDEQSTCGVERQSRLGRMLANVDLIIWDEVTMQHRFAFEAVNRLFCDLRQNKDELFGGGPRRAGRGLGPDPPHRAAGESREDHRRLPAPISHLAWP
jgi:PIF1-like helicase